MEEVDQNADYHNKISVTVPTTLAMQLEDLNEDDLAIDNVDVAITTSQLMSRSIDEIAPPSLITSFSSDGAPDAPHNSTTVLVPQPSRPTLSSPRSTTPAAPIQREQVQVVKQTRYKPPLPRKKSANNAHHQLGSRKPLSASSRPKTAARTGADRPLRVPVSSATDNKQRLSSRSKTKNYNTTTSSTKERDVICTMVSIVTDGDNDVEPPRSRTPVTFSNIHLEKELQHKLEASFSNLTTYTSKTLILEPDVPGPSEYKITLPLPTSPNLSRAPSMTSLNSRRQSTQESEQIKDLPASIVIQPVENEAEEQVKAVPAPGPTPTFRVRPPTAKSTVKKPSTRRPTTAKKEPIQVVSTITPSREKSAVMEEDKSSDKTSKTQSEHRCESAKPQLKKSATQSSLMNRPGSVRSGKSSTSTISGMGSRPFSAPVTRRPKSGNSGYVYYGGEPRIIMTRKRFAEVETEGILMCKEIHQKMEEKGVKINPFTIKRGLLPPNEWRQEKFELGYCTLPRNTHSGLLSNPSTWLPKEYAKVEQARKNLKQFDEKLLAMTKMEIQSRPSTAQPSVYTQFQRSGASRATSTHSQSSIGGNQTPVAAAGRKPSPASATGVRGSRKKSAGKRRPHSAEPIVPAVISNSSLQSDSATSIGSAAQIGALDLEEEPNNPELDIPETIEEELSSHLGSNYWETANQLLHSGLTPCNSKSDMLQ